MFWKRLEQQEKTLAAERGRSPSDAASVFAARRGPRRWPPARIKTLAFPQAPRGPQSPWHRPWRRRPLPCRLPPIRRRVPRRKMPQAIRNHSPKSLRRARRPRLVGTGKAHGRRLVKPEESPQPAMTAEQRC